MLRKCSGDREAQAGNLSRRGKGGRGLCEGGGEGLGGTTGRVIGVHLHRGEIPPGRLSEVVAI